MSVEDSDDNEDDDNDVLIKGPFEEINNEITLESFNETLINDSNPIMVCSNAMNKNHNCVFCKCFKCHMQESQNKDNGEKLKVIRLIINPREQGISQEEFKNQKIFHKVR